MVAQRTGKTPAPDLGHVPFVELEGRRIDAGDVLEVEGLGLVRFRWVDRQGNLTFSDADGAARTVKPAAVEWRQVAAEMRTVKMPKPKPATVEVTAEYAAMTPGQKAAYTKRQMKAAAA